MNSLWDVNSLLPQLNALFWRLLWEDERECIEEKRMGFVESSQKLHSTWVVQTLWRLQVHSTATPSLMHLSFLLDRRKPPKDLEGRTMSTEVLYYPAKVNLKTHGEPADHEEDTRRTSRTRRRHVEKYGWLNRRRNEQWFSKKLQRKTPYKKFQLFSQMTL